MSRPIGTLYKLGRSLYTVYLDLISTKLVNEHTTKLRRHLNTKHIFQLD